MPLQIRCVSLAALALASQAMADPQLLAVRFSAELLELDPITGEATHVADLIPPGDAIKGMGFDRLRNRMLVVNTIFSDELVAFEELNIVTGERNRILSFDAFQADAITHNAATDEVIIMNNFPRFVELDPQLEIFDSAGERRTVELQVGEFFGVEGMSAHPTSGRLLGITNEFSEPSRLVEIDQSNGEVTDLGYSIPDRGYGAMTFDPSGRFLYITSVGGGEEYLSRIEVGEADSFTDISRIDGGYFSLAFTPAPGTAMPLLASALVLTRRRR